MFFGLSLTSLLLLVLLSSCVSSSKQTTKLSLAQQKKLHQYATEVELGRNMAGRLLQYYGTYGDEQLVGYINQVGNYVAGYSNFSNRRFMFAILDTDSINAFACPGGYILVTLGALRNMHNEAELAMVLAHEIAHVGKKHLFNTLSKMSKDEQNRSARKVEKSSTNSSQSNLVRRRPEAKDNVSARYLARYMSGAAGPGVSILRAAKAGMHLILEQGLDKKLELEADTEGVRYAIDAGYSPNGLSSFLRRLQENNKQHNIEIIQKTHPSFQERQTAIRKVLVAVDAKNIIGADGSKRFKKYTANLPKIKSKN